MAVALLLIGAKFSSLEVFAGLQMEGFKNINSSIEISNSRFLRVIYFNCMLQDIVG